jgi:dsDNA-specific endonuclease/ATPase MutS2
MQSNYFEDPFLKILPTLDVHGEYADTVITPVHDFIYINQKMGKRKVAIIHGRHGGVLKTKIHEYLKREKLVTKYYLYNFNDGITIVELAPLVELL